MRVGDESPVPPCEGMQITFCAPSEGCLVNYLRLQIEQLSNFDVWRGGPSLLGNSLSICSCIVLCKFCFVLNDVSLITC